MKRGTYTGSDDRLKGKKALLRDHATDEEVVLAQFDDTTTGHGYGWTEFLRSSFEIDPPVDWGLR